MRALALIVGFFLVLGRGPEAAADRAGISVPLSVHEALRKGVEGTARKGGPVTAGLPFPPGAVRENDGRPALGMKGAEVYQFRTLAKWSDGSVRWALADFQANCPAGGTANGMSVVRGAGKSEGELLAVQTADRIEVNTGAMRGWIRKKGFDLLHRVEIDGKILVRDGKGPGIVLTAENGEKYRAEWDHESRVTIEENGPVRVVVKAEGSHRTRNGDGLLDYTVRMHFYRGKAGVRVSYTLRNASRKSVAHSFVRSIDLVTPLDAHGPLTARVGAHKGEVNALVEHGKDLLYYQAVSDFPQKYDGDAFYYRAPISPQPGGKGKRRFAQEGYWVRSGKETLVDARREEYPDLAYLDLSDEDGRGLTVGVRYAAGLWPKSLAAGADGSVAVGLFPKENERGYWVRFGGHTTFEILYEFHVKPNDPRKAMKEFQYPLVAKAPVYWYSDNATGIDPLYRFVSFEDEKQITEERGYSYRLGWRRPQFRVYRYHYWGWGGFENQHDFARIALVNFLRSDHDPLIAGEYFLQAEARFNYNADWAVYHSDDFDYSKEPIEARKNSDKADLAKVVFEWEHPHWYGLPLFYYLTGDERIREAVQDWSEVILARSRSLSLNYMRVFGWGMYSLASMYDFTGDGRFLDLADHNFRRLLDAKLDPDRPAKSIYVDWERGFVGAGSGSGWEKNRPGLKPGLMTGYIMHDGLYNYYLHLPDGHTLKRRVADVLEGLWDFMYREPYFEGEKGKNWAFWMPYIYDLTDAEKSQHGYKLLLEAFYANLAPWHGSRDGKWPLRWEKLLRSAAADSVWGHFSYLDHPGMQAILHEMKKGPPRAAGVSAPGDLSFERAGGRVRVGWTVPEGAVRFQVRVSRKMVVESLEYEREKKSYRYDPSTHVNWWAVPDVVEGEIRTPPGGRQWADLPRADWRGPYFVAVRTWNGEGGRSRLSSVEVKSQ